jgi:predicted alpha/beta superfamily hydrolase
MSPRANPFLMALLLVGGASLPALAPARSDSAPAAAWIARDAAVEAALPVEAWGPVPSREVAARNIDVLLPASYASEPGRRYPVLYMHDGQNLFDPGLSSMGVDWDVDGAVARLTAAGELREVIVVGVWNTPERTLEYAPAKALPAGPVNTGVPGRAPIDLAQVKSDAYLRFLVEELKPAIDARYRTLPGPADTVVMGSSMGGLISLYAVAEYPQVFGAAGAVSTHWPAADGAMVEWLGRHLPDPATHRLYFDYGTATLDAGYAPYQEAMDVLLRQAGYRAGENWRTLRFEGAEHNEAAWKARVDEPLRFLLGPPAP